MIKPKLAAAPVDSERMVRELLSALNSLTTKPAPLPCPSPEEEQPRQLSQQSQEDASKAVKLVVGALSTISADPRPEPRTPLRVLTEPPASDLAAEPEQVSEFESAENSETLDHRIEAQSCEHGIIEQFRGDHEAIERLRVTPEELQALSSSSLLGSLTCRQDVLFMLHQIREAMKTANLRATVLPEPFHAPKQSIERSTPELDEMAELIRRESWAKLNGPASSRGTVSPRALRLFGVVSWALILIAVWSGIKAMFNWPHHLSAELAQPALALLSMQRGAIFSKQVDYKILVSGEVLLVASVIVGTYLRGRGSLTQSRRYRPGSCARLLLDPMGNPSPSQAGSG